MSKKLTDKQDAFCRHYVISLNACDAARKAGFSETFATTRSSDLLTQPHMQARISELQAPSIARLEVSADHVIKELHRIATCDIGEAFDENGKFKALQEMPEDVRRCIQGIEVEELFEGYGKERVQIGVTKKIKFWDKNKGLELLGKHFKLYTDKHEVSGGLTLEALVTASQRKVEGENE